jgi:hypothetical protein
MSDLTPADQAAFEALTEVYGGTSRTDFAAARAVVAAVRPHIVAEILADHETEHIADFGPDTFSLQHPLRERLEGSLFDCDLHERLSAAGCAPHPPGRYRVTYVDNLWGFEPIDGEATR